MNTGAQQEAKMYRKMSNGGGTSSLGYLFGSQEAQKEEVRETVPLKVSVLTSQYESVWSAALV